MPKYTLKRSEQTRENGLGDKITTDFETQTKNGQKIIEKPFVDEKPAAGKEETKAQQAVFGKNRHPQTYNIFEAYPPEVVFNGLGQKDGIAYPTSYDIVIHECMDNMYRTGSIVFYDYNGFTEFTGLYNTYDDEHVSVLLKNKFEPDVFRKFNFTLYGANVENLDGNSLEKRYRKITYKMYEEPFFKNYNRQVYGDSFKNNKAIDIVSSLLVKKIGVKNLKKVNGDKDPLIPSFIMPNWTPKKAIEYLSNYCDMGPLKVFNVSQGEQTVTMVAPLSKFVDNQVYSLTYSLTPAATQYTKQAMKLGPYQIWGVNESQEVSFVRGETIMGFDYFYGKNGVKNFTDFSGENKYDFDKGDEKYALKERTYGSVVGGDYRSALEKSKRLGNITVHIRESMSKKDHIYDLDVEPKPLIQAKQFNRFYNSYFDTLMLYTVIPHSTHFNVGQIFDIIIPSVQQPKDGVDSVIKDDTLSGKWMLWKMDHVITRKETPAGPGGSKRTAYELHCYFVKTSFEISNRVKHDPDSGDNRPKEQGSGTTE